MGRNKIPTPRVLQFHEFSVILTKFFGVFTNFLYFAIFSFMYRYPELVWTPCSYVRLGYGLGLVILYFDLNFAYFSVILGTVGQGIIGLSMLCVSRPFWSSKISIDVLESPSSIGVQRLLLDCIFAGKSIANSVAATLSCRLATETKKFRITLVQYKSESRESYFRKQRDPLSSLTNDGFVINEKKF